MTYWELAVSGTYPLCLPGAERLLAHHEQVRTQVPKYHATPVQKGSKGGGADPCWAIVAIEGKHLSSTAVLCWETPRFMQLPGSNNVRLSGQGRLLQTRFPVLLFPNRLRWQIRTEAKAYFTVFTESSGGWSVCHAVRKLDSGISADPMNTLSSCAPSPVSL